MSTVKIVNNEYVNIIYILELWDEELNVKKIIAAIDATFAVAKRKPEKIRAYFRNRKKCVYNCDDLLYI